MSSKSSKATSAPATTSKKRISDDQKAVILTLDDREWLCKQIKGLKEENQRLNEENNKLRAMVEGKHISRPTSPSCSSTAILADSPRPSSSSSGSRPPSVPSASEPTSSTCAPGSSHPKPISASANSNQIPSAASRAGSNTSDFQVSNMIKDHFPEVMKLPAGNVPCAGPSESKAEGGLEALTAALMTA